MIRQILLKINRYVANLDSYLWRKLHGRKQNKN